MSYTYWDERGAQNDPNYSCLHMRWTEVGDKGGAPHPSGRGGEYIMYQANCEWETGWDGIICEIP